MKNVKAVSFLAVVVLIGAASAMEDTMWMENEIGTYTLVDLADNDTDLVVTISADELVQNVLLYLYTPSNPKISQRLQIEDGETLLSSNFNVRLPTRIVIHGWKNSFSSDMCLTIREAYLAAGEYNVIVVSWESISQKSYLNAAKHVGIIGKFVALMIDFLEEQGMDLDDLIIVGHSLGAHIGGIAARNAVGTVGYVVGLDPALPLFGKAAAGCRIAKGDAKYVQIIHTNAGLLGYLDAIGDADFYPNGGKKQPGCTMDLVGSCAHSRSYQYFAESLASTSRFLANYCANYTLYRSGNCSSSSGTVLMGGLSPTTSASGVYYLKTNKASPYATG